MRSAISCILTLTFVGIATISTCTVGNKCSSYQACAEENGKILAISDLLFCVPENIEMVKADCIECLSDAFGLLLNPKCMPLEFCLSKTPGIVGETCFYDM